MGKMKEIPVIELQGTSYEIGYQHGSILKDKILDFYNTAFELHIHNLLVSANKETLLAFCRRNIGYLKKYSAELYEELQGIADGSGLTLEDIVFLNSFLELEDIRPAELGAKLLSTRLWGCTSFNVLPEASKDGKPYVGQTFDMEKYYSKYNVILKIHPKEGPDEIVYSLAGVLGLNGMNSNGIAVSINKLVANDAREGVIYPFIIRKALSTIRVGDAFGAIVFTQRASGVNYQLTCKEGISWCIETSAGYYSLLPIQGAIAHTNHYLAECMRKYETPNWLTHGGSYVRHQVSSKILRDNLGKIDVELLKKLTSNHTNYPRCICAHGFDGQEENDAFTTIAAMIYDTTDGIMHVCHENPCTYEYKTIKF
ncbi:MAG: hypothetical protein K0R92_2198 [Lachnospiraceae bacterium]|jgi:isopenicillin-N N-acyltransferase-like protein|nr:hypothetical protein [Lachnospiraceae bacterium]